MTQRVKAKAKVAGPARGRHDAGSSVRKNSDEIVRALESERDRLLGELEAAKARIEQLETARADVINRIDWVIDSLEGALEKGA